MMAESVTKQTDFLIGGADRKYGRSKLVNRPARLGSSMPLPKNKVVTAKPSDSNGSGLRSEGSDALQSQSFVSLPSVERSITQRTGRTRPQSMFETSFGTTAANGRPTRSRNGASKGQTAESLISSFNKMHINRSQLSQATRKKIETVQDIARLIVVGHVKKIVVMVGAGISTPSGIPDFRTPGTGLYDNLQRYKIPYAEAIFDIDYFRDNPKPFFTLAKELYPSRKYQPNAVHYFLLMLHQRGLLHRVYTQNIDGLERLSGIPADKLVEAHGSFYSASCIDCHRSQPTDDVKVRIFDGKVPICKDLQCQGYVKPDIVFFGEDLPARFFKYSQDFSQADLLLVMGTSLKVEPFASIVNSVRFPVPRVLFNYSLVGPFRRTKSRMNDVVATGDIVERVYEFVELLGWNKEFDDILASKSLHRARLPLSADSVPSDASAAAVTDANAADTDSPHVGIKDGKTVGKLQSTASNKNARRSSIANDARSMSRRPVLPSLEGRSRVGKPNNTGRSLSTSSVTSSSSTSSAS